MPGKVLRTPEGLTPQEFKKMSQFHRKDVETTIKTQAREFADAVRSLVKVDQRTSNRAANVIQAPPSVPVPLQIPVRSVMLLATQTKPYGFGSPRAFGLPTRKF